MRAINIAIELMSINNYFNMFLIFPYFKIELTSRTFFFHIL